MAYIANYEEFGDSDGGFWGKSTVNMRFLGATMRFLGPNYEGFGEGGDSYPQAGSASPSLQLRQL